MHSWSVVSPAPHVHIIKGAQPTTGIACNILIPVYAPQITWYDYKSFNLLNQWWTTYNLSLKHSLPAQFSFSRDRIKLKTSVSFIKSKFFPHYVILMIFVSIRSLTKCSSALRIFTLIIQMLAFKARSAALFPTASQFAFTASRQKKIRTAAAAWKGTQWRLIRLITLSKFADQKLESSCSLLSNDTASLQDAYQHGNSWQQEALVDCRLWWDAAVHLSRITFIEAFQIKITHLWVWLSEQEF